jgi:hypothetical protein
MKAIVTEIKYDTDGEEVDLPTQLEIEIPNEITEYLDIEEFVSDEISNITGFCHYGFEIKLIDNTTFTVRLEFTDIDAKNPLEAVKKILCWINNTDEIGGAETFIYDVINEETSEEFTVDMSEKEEDAVLPK